MTSMMTRKFAADPTTPPEVLCSLAKKFPATVAKNPNASYDTLFALAETHGEQVLSNPAIGIFLLECPGKGQALVAKARILVYRAKLGARIRSSTLRQQVKFAIDCIQTILSDWEPSQEQLESVTAVLQGLKGWSAQWGKDGTRSLDHDDAILASLNRLRGESYHFTDQSVWFVVHYGGSLPLESNVQERGRISGDMAYRMMLFLVSRRSGKGPLSLEDRVAQGEAWMLLYEKLLEILAS